MERSIFLILMFSFTLALCSEQKWNSDRTSLNSTVIVDDSIQRVYSFRAINWDALPLIEHAGVSGKVSWHEVQLNGLKLRSAEFSKGFLGAFCDIGHIVYCIDGEFTIKKSEQKEYRFTKGMAFVVSDSVDAHQLQTSAGCKVFIVDGDFLSSNRHITRNLFEP